MSLDSPLVLGGPVQLLVDQGRRPQVGQGEQGLGVVAGEVGDDPGRAAASPTTWPSASIGTIV